MQLQPSSIQPWDDLQRTFLAQFVSSKEKVSIMDLAHTLQSPNKPANDFITRWRSLKLQCPEKLSEEACVQMCTNNLIPDGCACGKCRASFLSCFSVKNLQRQQIRLMLKIIQSRKEKRLENLTKSSLFKNGKKRNTLLMTMMSKGFLKS
ncbi:hypothetical protein V2J09_006332 [Rumex salicifolius]